MSKLIGQSGSVDMGGTLDVSNWEITFDSDLPDVTDTGANGWQEVIPGIKKCDFTFTLFVDGDTIAALASALEPGTSVTGTFNIGNSGESYVIPGYTKTNSIKNPAKNPIELTVSGTSSGRDYTTFVKDFMEYTVIKTGDKEYKLAKPSIKLAEQFLNWTKTVLPNPYQDLVGILDKIPKEYAQQLLDDAKKKASMRGTINDPDAEQLMQTIEGAKQAIYLRLKPFHPEITPDDAFDIIDKAQKFYGDKWEAVMKEAGNLTGDNTKLTEEQAETTFFRP